MEDKDLIKAFPNAFGSEGMSLRDYFAAAVITGLLAAKKKDCGDAEIALSAYFLADVMLEARRH